MCIAGYCINASFNEHGAVVGSGHGLEVRVLDSGLQGRGFHPHTGHGSLLNSGNLFYPKFASVYSSANEYQHCWEGTCDVQGSQYNCALIACAK